MNKGFSLVEVLVATSISAVVGLGMWTIINSAMSSSSRFLDRQEFDEALRLVQFTLMREDQCKTALKADAAGAKVKFPVDPNITNPSSQVYAIMSRSTGGVDVPLIQSNQPFGRVKIGQMQIREISGGTGRGTEMIYNDPANPTVPTRYNTHLVNLEIPGARAAGSPINTAATPDVRNMETLLVPFKIYVNLTPGIQLGNIDSCFFSYDDNQTCGSFGGRFDPSNGKCQMAQCSNVNADIQCQTPIGGSTCTNRVYFWGFASDGVVTRPVCICQQTCSPPPIPPPSPGPY